MTVINRCLIGMLLGTLLVACSNQAVYSTLQTVETSRCVEGPANAYQECMQHNNMDYAEYEELRRGGKENSE